MTLFKEIFTHAYRDLHQQQHITTGSVYDGHSKNLVFKEAKKLWAETIDVLIELASAIAEDHAAVNSLTVTNTKLAKQLSQATHDITMLAELSKT